MNFELSPDQLAIMDAVEKLAGRHRSTALLVQRSQYSPALEKDLQDSGFFECQLIEELGSIAATALVMSLVQLPLCAEVAASALVAPVLASEGCVGPFAVVWAGHETAPTRFLPVAKTVIRIAGTRVETVSLDEGQVDELESLFAYPMGALKDSRAQAWTLHPQIDAQRLATLWRIGIGAEIVGCLEAGLQAVLSHVRERRQFGRPLGSFQAVQHRLAECAVLIEGVRWLVFKAASTCSRLDADLALAQAQSIVTPVCYDLHQFMGAMGLTLEHPLHRWTYRAKLLRSDCGGADRHFMVAADAAWPCQRAGAQEPASQLHGVVA